MDYIHDIPADARPEHVYGTPEYERARLSKHAPLRRHVRPEQVPTPTDAKAMLARYAEIRRSMWPTVVKPAPIPQKPVIPAPAHDVLPNIAPRHQPRRKCEFALYDVYHTTRPTLYPERFGPPTPMRRINRADVLRVVVFYYNATLDGLLGPKRHKEAVRPRQIAMYLVREVLGMSYPELGRVFGRDHSTALHAVTKIASLLETDEVLANDIAQMKIALGVRS